MSPRAACRLATLGFERVYDYMPGKADWMARGLGVEGEKAGAPRAIDFARRDVVTCHPDDALGEVRARVQASAYGFAFVLSSGGVLLGRLRKQALEHGREMAAGELMEPGPSTNRPDIAPADLLSKLEKGGLKTAVLTDPEGRLLGLVRSRDLEHA